MKTKKTRHRRQTNRTKQKLLSSARSLFAEKGFNLTTIDDITEKANTGKGTFYYHYHIKEMLINDLIENLLNELEDSIREYCAGIFDLEKLLDGIIQAHIDFFSNRWEDFVLYFQGWADLILDNGYESINTPFVDYINTIENHIDSVAKYRFSRTALHRIACAVTGFISGYYSFSSISLGIEDTKKIFYPVRGALTTSVLSTTLLYIVIARGKATKQSHWGDCQAPFGRSQ